MVITVVEGYNGG